MIYKHQRILFWCLVVCILVMIGVLFTERQRGRERVRSVALQMPLDAPTASSEPITLELAHDADGSLAAVTRQMALPLEVNARARAVLDHLVAEYALPGSPHPLPPGEAVQEVFLIPLPVVGYAPKANAPARSDGYTASEPVAPQPGSPESQPPVIPGGELAVIDLRSSFVNQHPSGVEVESLTLRSMVRTLHDNLPEIEQVRFMVDGEARDTLAGHADLLRTYSALPQQANQP